jgi:diguanylate cyclase (GGDEF)-like protein
LAFLAIALLLAATAAWVAGRFRERSVADAADARLASSLRAGVAGVGSELREASVQARTLSLSPQVERAFMSRDQRTLVKLALDRAGVAFVLPNGKVIGAAPAQLRRTVEVTDRTGRPLGRVLVSISPDEALLARIRVASGTPPADGLAIARNGRLITPAPPGDGNRSMSTLLARGTDLRLVAYTRESISQTVSDTRRRVFIATLLTLAVLALAWLTAVRLLPERAAIAPARRRKADEGETTTSRRVREAVALVGEALAATHDPDALLPVILESAVGATGAVGARLVSDGAERFRAGRPEIGGPPLTLSLGTEDEHVGSLLIYPEPGRPFSEDEGRLAHWLAAQASIALENARLHRAVEQQAITDHLTGLANRRRFAETLSLEVSRAERFSGTLALVFADLDDFKTVNDLYGHQVGDDVLRRFADLMRESVREFDLAVRHGGEEFALLLPETDLEGGVRLAERLAEALRGTRFPDWSGKTFSVTSSFGVSAFPGSGSAEQLILAADRALYRAKKEGKNRVVVAQGE